VFSRESMWITGGKWESSASKTGEKPFAGWTLVWKTLQATKSSGYSIVGPLDMVVKELERVRRTFPS